MRRKLRQLAWGVVLLCCALVALYAYARLRGPSPEQREALAVLQRVPPTGRNAFPALWLLGYEVPPAQHDAVMETDRRAFAALTSPQERSAFESVAAARYRKWELDATDRALLCEREQDCAARIAADPAAYRSLVARHAALIARIRNLPAFDYSRSVWPTGEVLPGFMPLTKGVRLALVEDRLAFAAGDRARALGNVCAMTTGMRRLMRSPENLIDSMVFATVGRDLVQVYADMLAVLPGDEPLPPACVSAFAPATAQEMSLCEPMRGEFVFLANVLPEQLEVAEEPTGVAWRDALHPILFDEANTQAQRAVQLARACSPGVARQIARDLRVTWNGPPASPWRLECLGNATGCWAMDIGGPPDEAYQHRLQDYGARMRLVGALQWLREHPDDQRSLDQRLAGLPAALLSPERPIEVVEGGKALRVRLYEVEREGPYWTIPLGG